MAKGNSGSRKGGKVAMTQKAVSRIQSAEARANGGKVAKGGFAARAQATVTKITK